MAEYLVETDPKSISPQQYRQLFRRFLENFELKQVQLLLCSDVDADLHHTITVNAQDLIHFDSALSYSVFHYPKLLLPLFVEALLELQSELSQHSTMKAKCPSVALKHNCHVRIISLPPTSELSKLTISDVKAHEVSSLIQITGTVVRTGGVRMLEQSKQYECQYPKCRHRFTVCADPEQDNMLPQPRCCPAKGGLDGKSKCTSTNVREVEGCSVCVDYQEIKIQDHIERLDLGTVPRTIIVVLHSDLVDRHNPGDEVVVVGTVVRQWRPLNRGTRCAIDIAVEANSILVVNTAQQSKPVTDTSSQQFTEFWSGYRERQCEFAARDVILKAVCPQLFGMFFVKLSLLLALIGGNSTSHEGGVKRRSQSHMLIVGDPGCGKSQLLRFAASLVPRSVLTTGIGTTGAGLTCTAVREGNDWCLEAGALVLSNDGVCCIDEFASIREQDRATIHEAMEQQTLSVAKAGLVVKLNTRATVIACCNPKGRYDMSADLTANTAIASPLLSRFDLILVLMDTASKEWDKEVSTFLLMQAVGIDGESVHASSKQCSAEDSRQAANDIVTTDIWSVETLRQYLSFAKSSIHPVMTAEARCLLMRYYQLQRQSDERSSSRTTVRLLESLLRLSEAHAKLMCREQVTAADALVAIHCISLSNPFGGSMLDVQHNSTKEGFCQDPTARHLRMEEQVLRLLHYTREMLAKDVQRQQSGSRDVVDPVQAAVSSAVERRHVPIQPTDTRDFPTIATSLTASSVARQEHWLASDSTVERALDEPPLSVSKKSRVDQAAALLRPTALSVDLHVSTNTINHVNKQLIAGETVDFMQPAVTIRCSSSVIEAAEPFLRKRNKLSHFLEEEEDW